MTYYETVSGLQPSYWWKLDGDRLEEYGNANPDGYDEPDWVNSIIPTISGTNQCGDFNGSSDELRIPNKSDINSAVTYYKSISFWIEPDDLATTNNGAVIWGEGGTVNALTVHVHNGSLWFHVCESSNRDTVGFPLTTGSLYHVVATLDTAAQSMKLYVNGSLVGSDMSLAISTSFNSHSAGCGIGGPDANIYGETGQTMTNNFEGRIADMAYWGENGSVLTAANIGSIYEAGIGGGGGPDVNTTTINSDGTIQKYDTSTINSDAYIKKYGSETITSDTYIKKLSSDTINSDTRIEKTDTTNITSDSYIKKLSSETITSEGRIKSYPTQTITSDATIIYISEDTINSDTRIGQNIGLSVSGTNNTAGSINCTYATLGVCNNPGSTIEMRWFGNSSVAGSLTLGAYDISNGSPNDLLFSDTIEIGSASSPSWHVVSGNYDYVVNEGSYYLAWMISGVTV